MSFGIKFPKNQIAFQVLFGFWKCRKGLGLWAVPKTPQTEEQEQRGVQGPCPGAHGKRSASKMGLHSDRLALDPCPPPPVSAREDQNERERHEGSAGLEKVPGGNSDHSRVRGKEQGPQDIWQ